MLIFLFDQSNSNNSPNKKLEFLNSFSPEILKIINPNYYSIDSQESNSMLRYFFEFYATNSEYYIEGIKFFSKFSSFIKTQEFNSIKAFIFYFAYMTKKYSSQEVKDILNQTLLNVSLSDNKSYLDFCMYCFYRGMYCLEKKDFYMAAYYYTSAVSIGIKNNLKNIKFLNSFNTQMIRSLCFLKFLTNFDVASALFKESRLRYDVNDISLIDHEDVSFCLDFIKDNKNDLNTFRTFTLQDEDNIKHCKLNGLFKAAEDEVYFNMIKEKLKIYKRTTIAKLSTFTQLDYDVIMRILKKKVLEGEINIKYDESQDIIEVYDTDPGLKEKVEKTKQLYEKIIEGNKNLFIDKKNQKLDALSGKEKGKEIDITDMDIENQGYDPRFARMEEEDFED